MPERERGALAEELRNTIFESGEEVNELLKSKVVSSAFAAVILYDGTEVMIVREKTESPAKAFRAAGLTLMTALWSREQPASCLRRHRFSSIRNR